MPIHLPSISRRHFLAGTLTASARTLLPSRSFAAEEVSVDPACFAILSDIHICHDQNRQFNGAKPVEACSKACQEILALPTRPSATFVAGDCAFLKGKQEDYTTLRDVFLPLRKNGMSVHFALGNHDNREHFLATHSSDGLLDKSFAPVPGKHVSVLETPYANWFLLDSLEKTDATPGSLGKAQLAWLSKSLDARPDKPALLLAHHNPQGFSQITGLRDTEAFFEILMPRKQVKALFFGHTHQWKIEKRQDLHLVNLPTTAWLFDRTQPRGFIELRLRSDRATLTLHALNHKHAKHSQEVDLHWRS